MLRRELYPDVHEWDYCGIAMGADATLKNFASFGHAANQAYQYAAVAVLGNGFISQICEAVRLDFDAGRVLIQPLLPIYPINVTAAQLAGGKFRITWEYEPYGQGGFPKDFQVFEGASAGSVDYNAPLTDSATGLNIAAYSAGRRVYSFTTAAFSNQTPHVFGVRGRNANGVAEKNTYTTASKLAKVTAPIAAAAPLRANVRPYSRKAG